MATKQETEMATTTVEEIDRAVRRGSDGPRFALRASTSVDAYHQG